MSVQVSEGGVCVPVGFRAAGVRCGIKKGDALDLALVVSDVPAAAAGTFTTNLAAAAPVRVSRERVSRGSARGVVLNSGCANACTGERGIADALEMASAAARAVKVNDEEILVCSTGHIGTFLPMAEIRSGVTSAAAALGGSDWEAARAIMTTDTLPKRAAVWHPDGWRIGGMAKGAGMIAPNMATMLAVITTDADVDSDGLQKSLRVCVDGTFNVITVDGDTSTNDSVIALANGAAGVTPDPRDFHEALYAVAEALAEAIVADGEGAGRLIRVRVSGAMNEEDARRAARAVGESLLVKTAVYGGDPNWGRVAAALGRSGAEFDLRKLSISIAGVSLFARGTPTAKEAVSMDASEIEIACDLGAGESKSEILSCDLTPDYVRLNAEYPT